MLSLNYRWDSLITCGSYVESVSRVCLCWGTLRISLKDNSDAGIYSAEKSFWKPAAPPQFAALSYAVEKNSHMFPPNTHSRTFCTVFSRVPPNLGNNCQTRSCLRRLSARAAETAPVRYKSNNGWEFLYGWATPNKTCSWSCVLLFQVG